MFYNFRTCYSTVSNMRRYGQKCHFRIIIFYSIFSLSSQYLIQRFLSLQPMFSLSLSSSDHPPSSLNQRYSGFTDQAADHRSSHRPHRSSRRHCFSFEDSIIADLKTPSFYVSVWHSHRPLATPISGLWVCANGECRCGFVPVVGLGCGFVWFGGCGFVSICLVFFFFFEVALVDVGLCRW